MPDINRPVVDRQLTILLSVLAAIGIALCIVGWYRWAT
jgi:hypothetical protein